MSEFEDVMRGIPFDNVGISIRLDRLLRKHGASACKLSKNYMSRGEKNRIYFFSAGGVPESADDTRRIFITSAIHGYEGAYTTPACVEFLEAFLNQEDKRYSNLFKRWRVFLIPVANPNGFFHGSRENAPHEGTNLNRDFDDLSQTESKSIASYFDTVVDSIKREKGREWVDTHPNKIPKTEGWLARKELEEKVGNAWVEKHPSFNVLLDLHGSNGEEHFILEQDMYEKHKKLVHALQLRVSALSKQKRFDGYITLQRARRPHHFKEFTQKNASRLLDYSFINPRGKPLRGVFTINPQEQNKFRGMLPGKDRLPHVDFKITSETKSSLKEFQELRWLRTQQFNTAQAQEFATISAQHIRAKIDWIRESIVTTMQTYDDVYSG